MQWKLKMDAFSNAEELVAMVDANHAMMVFYLYGAFKPRDHSVVDEVLQGFLIKLWQKYDRIKTISTEKLNGYLLMMLRNEYLDYLRKEKKGQRAEIDEKNTQHLAVELYHGCPEEAHANVLQVLKSILKRSDHYEVMRMHLEGFSYLEIEEIMNIPLGTVGTIIRRSKEKLRRHLDQ